MTHKTEELEKQAELIKRFETAYNDSSSLMASKDEEIATLAEKNHWKSEKLSKLRQNLM